MCDCVPACVVFSSRRDPTMGWTGDLLLSRKEENPNLLNFLSSLDCLILTSEKSYIFVNRRETRIFGTRCFTKVGEFS